MRIAFLLSALLALAPLSAAVAADEPEANFPSLDRVGLAWKVRPDGGRMARFFPARAKAQKVTRGMAMLDCTARVNGKLDCVVAYETPGDLQFGQAGLSVIKTSVVEATDGQAIEGRKFSFTLRFGYWPPSTLPGLNRRGLEKTNLVWRVFPALGDHWKGATPHGDDRFVVTLKCSPKADGYLQCEAIGSEGAPEGFPEAAAAAMADARVKDQDGGSPEGQTFTYQFILVAN